MKNAEKSGVKDAPDAAMATTIVTPWIYTKEELEPDRVKLVKKFANVQGIDLRLSTPKQGTTTLRLQARKTGSATGSDRPDAEDEDVTLGRFSGSSWNRRGRSSVVGRSFRVDGAEGDAVRWHCWLQGG